MTQRIALGICLVVISFSVGLAQPPETNPIRPASATTPAAPKMSESLRRVYVSARSGAEWLLRGENTVNGRFHPGWVPDLNVPVERDRYLHQAGATVALAKAARHYGDARYLMKARQATLSLLAETQLDPADATCRYTALPTLVVNRLASAGMLLLAIHELQEPAPELLKQGEELAQFIRKQQQADGSLTVGDGDGDPGLALYGLLQSQRHRPAPWKLELVAKALPFYRKQWKANPSLSLAASLTPAFTEAFVRSRERAYADFVFEMSDWACEQQYGPDTSHVKWIGGFKDLAPGQTGTPAPTVVAARNLDALAHACLVTRHAADQSRYSRYKEALDLGATFLIGLQYTETNTLHFIAGYRPALIGGFHGSHQEGNLRLDQHADAMSALIGRLTCVGDR